MDKEWDLRPSRSALAAPDTEGMPLTANHHRRAVALVRHVPVPVEAAVALLEHDPHRVIGSHLGAPWNGMALHADLAVELFGRRAVAREVSVGIGPLIEDEDALALPLWWQAAEHPQLFPTFDGGIELRRDEQGTELRLVGSYRPPLGAVGRFADGVLGHRVVMTSLERFLTAVTERLGAALAPAAD